MNQTPLPPTFFQKNRKAFCDMMQPNSVAIIASNDMMPSNADGMMGYIQNNDLLYLSGIEQEETVLAMYPNAYKEEEREILFIRRSSEELSTWDGDKLSKEKAIELSGIETIIWVDELEKNLDYFVFEADTIYLGHNEHKKRTTRDLETRQDRLIQRIKQLYPLHDYERAAKITRHLRPLKSTEEIALTQAAADIGVQAFHRVLKLAKPGVMEYEIDAEIHHEILKNGGLRHAFHPIVAGGKNACVLHYNQNDQMLKDGEMVLLDFGACYGNYNSDTTRCFPVNGRFTKRQKEVYTAVLHCLREGSKLLMPGASHADYEESMAKLIEEQLVNLGLLSMADINNQDPKKPAYKKYFMHGTAHHLGLDVHDVGLYHRPIEAGMIFTCEPGIYIREEGLGCRLEDDFLITENGNNNLTENMPIEIEEIENLMTVA